MAKTQKDLYKRYKSTSVEDIQRYLKNIKIVREKNGKYYPISDDHFNKILTKPRNVSLTFDATELNKTPLKLEELKSFEYLVKSSSRFFLKPDIGEVFDQIDKNELSNVTAICVDIDNYQGPIDREGEHFIMEAKLMTNIKEIRREKLKKIENENS